MLLVVRRPARYRYWALRSSLAVALTLAWPFVGRHHATASALVERLPGTVLQLAACAAALDGSGPPRFLRSLSGVVVFSEDDRVAAFSRIQRTLELWRMWPVRQWWKRMAREDKDDTEENGGGESAVAHPNHAVHLKQLGTEMPSTPLGLSIGGQEQQWLMAVLQHERSPHAAHFRAHPIHYKRRLAWLVQSVCGRSDNPVAKPMVARL